MEKIVLKVGGMKCGGCEASVKSALTAVDGVDQAKADHKLQQVEIEFDRSVISIEKLKEVITRQGYSVNS
jgi:copper chaperone